MTTFIFISTDNFSKELKYETLNQKEYIDYIGDGYDGVITVLAGGV